MSDVAVQKRLASSVPFLLALLGRLLATRVNLPPANALPWRIRPIDATTVSHPGSTGADWRIHATFDAVRGAFDTIEVTAAKSGEHLDRAAPKACELLLGDRGYAHADRIGEVRAAGAHVLVRVGHRADLVQPLTSPFTPVASGVREPGAQVGEAGKAASGGGRLCTSERSERGRARPTLPERAAAVVGPGRPHRPLRHRRRPMIFTTNTSPLPDRGDAFHDRDPAHAIVDRVIERGRLLVLDGPSYRTRHIPADTALTPGSDAAGVSGNHRPAFPEPAGGTAQSVQPAGFRTPS